MLRTFLILPLLCGLVVADVAVEDAPRRTLEPTHVLIDAPVHELAGTRLSVSPDGRSLLICNGDGRGPATIRDAVTGRVELTVTRDRSPAKGVIFLDNDRFAVVWGKPPIASERRKPIEATIHDRKTGNILHTLITEAGVDASLELATDSRGDRLVLWSKSVEIWNTTTAQREHVIDELTLGRKLAGGRHRTCAITRDDTKLLLANAGQWRVYGMHDGKPLGEVRDVEFDTPVTFSPDGRLASAACLPVDGFYDVATGQRQPPPAPRDKDDGLPLFKPTTQNIFYYRSAFSHDGRRWAGQDRNQVYVFDLSEKVPKLMCRLLMDDSHHRRLEWSRDGKRLFAFGNTNGSSSTEPTWIGDWDVDAAAPSGGSRVHNNTIAALDVSPDGTEFMTADCRGAIVRWSVRELAPIKSLPPELPGFAGTVVESARYTVGSDKILVGGQNTDYTWYNRDLKVASRYRFRGTSIFSASNDGSLIFTEWVFNKPRVQLYKPPAAESVASLDVGQYSPRDAAFLPGDKTLVMTNAESLQLYDTETLKPLRTLSHGRQVGRTSVWKIAVSPDGRWVLALSHASAVAWDLMTEGETIEPRWSLRFNSPAEITYSPTGGIAYVCWADGVTAVELTSGVPLATLDLPHAPARFARALGTGPLLAVVTSASRLETYDLMSLLAAPDDMKRSPDDLWARVNDESRDAMAALIELSRRDQLRPRVQSMVESAAERRKDAAAAKDLIARLDAVDKAERERAHRQLEGLAPRVVSELKAALLVSGGEKAERLAAILRLAGDAPAADDPTLFGRLREVLSLSPRDADQQTARLLTP